MAMKMSKKTSRVKKVIKKTKRLKTTKAAKVAKSEPTFTVPQGTYVEGVGRRKVATARVRIYKTEGDFVVNNKLANDYFSAIKNAVVIYTNPFELTGTKGKFAVTVRVTGSGVRAQLGAVVHGLSRALVKFDPDFRSFLKPAGVLTRDDRMKETRKIGTGGKARRKRQSPKR